MTNEVREKLTPAEAAARLRAYRQRVANNEVDSDDFLKSVGECYPVLVEAYLEQNPADDEEAIDKAFCKSLGATIIPFDDGGWCADFKQRILISVFSDGGAMICGLWLPYKLTTRRQLRDLLRVMGWAK